MAYFVVEDFKGGLDVRRSEFTSVAGTLQVGSNIHITRGGDVETRKAFVDYVPFTSNTFGLYSDKNGLVTFGSVASPGALDPAIRYVRLVAPTSANMVSVDASTLFNGLLEVVATYSDGTQWMFYDGALVQDWGGGIVRPYMINDNGIAKHLESVINASANYTATRSGSSINITGPLGLDYDAVVTVENAVGGTDDQSLVLSTVSDAVVAVAATRAIAEFQVVNGSVGAGNYISDVTVKKASGDLHLLAANVMFETSPQITALRVAQAINTGGNANGYTAYTISSRVILYAPQTDGSTINSVNIEATAKGNVVLYSGSFKIAGGVTGTMTSIKAGGIEILGSTITWTTSNTNTASLIAAAINAYASVPKYNAFASGETVFVSPQTIKSSDGATITIITTETGDMVSAVGDVPPASHDPDFGNGAPSKPGTLQP